MSFFDRLAGRANDEVKTSGRAYFVDGAVRLENVTDFSVAAAVQGREGRYNTNLSWNGNDGVRYSCSCEAFRHSRSVCRHLFATLLAADAQGYLPGRSRNGQDAALRRAAADDEADSPRPLVRHQPGLPTWKKHMASLADAVKASRSQKTEAWPAGRQILYIVDLPASVDGRTIAVKLAVRDRRRGGDWSRPKTRGVAYPDVADLDDPTDQRIMALLKGSLSRYEYFAYDPTFRVPESMRLAILSAVAGEGRAFLRVAVEEGELHPLAWDEGGPWQFFLEARADEQTEQYVITGSLRRDQERMALNVPLMVPGGGVMILNDRVARLDDRGAFAWIPLLRQHRSLLIPAAQREQFLEDMLKAAELPRLDFPEELKLEEVLVKPRPRLRVKAAGAGDLQPDKLRAQVSFEYGGVEVPSSHPTHSLYDKQTRRVIVRDEAAEREAEARLRPLGFRSGYDAAAGQDELRFPQHSLPRVVRVLAQEGWSIEADGRMYRQSGQVRLDVKSGIDWFELRGDVDFGDGQRAALPDLLKAMRRGETFVKLGDGTFGILPEAWLKRYGVIAGVGTQEEDHVRFMKSQAGLLDALLASQPQATVDEVFRKVSDGLRSFDGVSPREAPPQFVGELRPYQKDSLGWFEFLQRFGFGGCLADDMGLGKTVQVLALLSARRSGEAAPPGDAGAEAGAIRGPSLVVVPRSLVFNWQQEAARFAPGLRLLDHTGIDRAKSASVLGKYDVVLTTYGTLRRDVMFLKDTTFDYVVLDEAQAVKNPASESAKAVRLVKAQHRLALSGTPVQNHLGDLWSLFDFLNPGLLGTASVFASTAGVLRNPEADTRSMLSRALRPFILRRTKEQVAPELPAKTEQTLYCELEADQRKLYDDLRAHYRRSLLDQVEREGINKSKIQILEALLRLRQAALHPGLIDKERVDQPSAKLDLLLPRLAEVIDEGHKALVFSQFTSMLAIVKTALDRDGVVYEYLDGKTRDRQARVERFQNDPECRIFLVSLKAGGLGLNLTAADYVFLLDPWWNPAVEAQAIDRSHRIGQTRPVYACRLIARDTVEEKVLALQKTKRDLADAIINEDNSLIRTLDRDDLELLLS